MKISELWLREWVNSSSNSVDFSEQMTMLGLEVENIEPAASIFNGIVVGEIVKCSQHPNSNKFYITKINIGHDRLLNIICSATNCRQGIKVAVAVVGTVLPSNYKIKEIMIFGEISEGMLCSFLELGIFCDKKTNIIELPDNATVGNDIRNYLQLNDNIIEISITSNRADCLSILGIARDIAAVNNLPLKSIYTNPVEVTTSKTIPIHINEISACPLYLGRVLKGLNMKAVTPLWIKEKLRRCGIHCINPVVDITNYVLLELGQPMHAFDFDCIDRGIIVRMSQKNESLVLIDNREIKFSEDILVVADHSKILSIAGVIGGKHSSVNIETQDVLFECAFFNPEIISRCNRNYGFYTEASYRYERGVDPNLQYKAIERATDLLLSICGGKAGPIINKTEKNMLPRSKTIMLRRKKLDSLLGHPITNEQVNRILVRLGCDIIARIDEWKVLVPSWRFDLIIEEDLIEEIARIYGYNNILNTTLKTNLIIFQHRESDLSLKRVKYLLVDKGYQEVITYSFVNAKQQQLLHPDKKALILPHPISSDMSAMRLSLWTGLINTVLYNQNRQQSRIRLFESGLCFIPDKNADFGVYQKLMLAGALSGNRYEEHWDLNKQEVDFYDLKGDLESLLDLTGKLNEISFRSEKNPALHPGQSAGIYLLNERIGFIGNIHPRLEKILNLHGHVFIFELSWDKVAHRILPNACEISKFPANRRDISIIVDKNIPISDIIKECKKIGVDQLVCINLSDVYCGNNITEGKKSLTINLILQDINRTLEEEEINFIISKYVVVLKERFQATLRD